jgi:hypothetical protein
MAKDIHAAHRSSSTKARATNGALVCAICHGFVVAGEVAGPPLFCNGHGVAGRAARHRGERTRTEWGAGVDGVAGGTALAADAG